MRYCINVYRARSVYLGLRFYTAWAEPGRSRHSVYNPSFTAGK